MAYIPYGYRVADGAVEVDEEQRERLLAFFRKYIAGETIESACSGIPLSPAACTRLLDNRAYLGEGGYPQIIPQPLWQELHEERLKRKLASAHSGHYRRAAPIYTQFTFIDMPRTSIQDLYDCIVPAVYQPPVERDVIKRQS